MKQHRPSPLYERQEYLDSVYLLARLETELTRAMQSRVIVVRVIHGCGSTGKGGALRDACRAYLRPHIVWFGEMPRIEAALKRADLFVAIGTSGQIYPAAGFVHEARQAGAETVEINTARTETSAHFDRRLAGPATEQVPAFVESLIERSRSGASRRCGIRAACEGERRDGKRTRAACIGRSVKVKGAPVEAGS